MFNFYYLSPPDSRLVILRNKKIKICKETMGDKWLLAKPVTKKENK